MRYLGLNPSIVQLSRLTSRFARVLLRTPQNARMAV